MTPSDLAAAESRLLRALLLWTPASAAIWAVLALAVWGWVL